MIIQCQSIIAYLPVVRAPRGQMRNLSHSPPRVLVSDQLFCNQWKNLRECMNLDVTKNRDLSIPHVGIQTHGRLYDIQK